MSVLDKLSPEIVMILPEISANGSTVSLPAADAEGLVEVADAAVAEQVVVVAVTGVVASGQGGKSHFTSSGEKGCALPA